MLWSDIKHTDEEGQFSVTLFCGLYLHSLDCLFILVRSVLLCPVSRSKYCVTDGQLFAAIGSKLMQAG